MKASILAIAIGLSVGIGGVAAGMRQIVADSNEKIQQFGCPSGKMIYKRPTPVGDALFCAPLPVEQW